MSASDWNATFQWKCQPEAENFCLELLAEACKLNSDLASLQESLLSTTSTRLFDWVDHFAIANSEQNEKRLQACGYVPRSAGMDYRVFSHPGAQLPRIVMHDHDAPLLGVAVGVEHISDYLMAHGLSGHIEGTPLSGYRRCLLSTENNVPFWVVERRYSESMEPTYPDESSIGYYYQAKELWKTRPRHPKGSEEELMSETLSIASELISLVGRDEAAWIVFECEREYWQSRNHAGQLQKNRQDRLGMGWANHDHHTFRSSRKLFPQLVRLFEMLGFSCRERFWAGAEAGWGAQVVENPRCRLVLFLDVDLLPEEINIDFAHHALPEISKYNTVGLWCALHGDSVLQAGLHHLEAQFMFESLTSDLSQQGVGMMEPFSNFPYLKQAFTQAEMWRVNPERVDRLLQAGAINAEQASKFNREGAVGSHLENLQRREGYKGFNQKNVSFIIQATDPRNITA